VFVSTSAVGPTRERTAGRAGSRPARGRVVAVTAARAGVAKRGLAAGIARVLAGEVRGRVCVVDADVDARDVGLRFGIARPTGAELAFHLTEAGHDPLSLVARDDATGCWVVPASSRTDERDLSPYARLVDHLRAHVDHLVVDTPAPLAPRHRHADDFLALTDELLVATTTEAEDVPALVRYLNRMTRGRVTGEVPSELEIRVVPTGDPKRRDGILTLAKKIRTVEVADAVPRLWGRGASSPESQPTDAPEALKNLVAHLAVQRR
jgi:hypothetical protein